MVARLNSPAGRVLGANSPRAYNQTHDGSAATYGQNPSSPALSAMATTGGRARNPFAQALNPQAPQPGQGPFSAATVDTTQAEGAFNQGIAANQKLIDEQRGFGENFMQSLQRRNGSNAALMGLSAGGGSYLAGQRAAFSQGINALNQSLLPFAQQQAGMYQGLGNMFAGAATTNAGNLQQTGIANTQYGIDQERSGQDAKTQYYANQIARIDERSKTQSDIGGDDGVGPNRAKFMNLRAAYDKAVSEGNWGEADRIYNELNSMMNWSGGKG